MRPKRACVRSRMHSDSSSSNSGSVGMFALRAVWDRTAIRRGHGTPRDQVISRHGAVELCGVPSLRSAPLLLAIAAGLFLRDASELGAPLPGSLLLARFQVVVLRDDEALRLREHRGPGVIEPL